MVSTRRSIKKIRKKKSKLKILLIFLLFVTTFVSSYLITSFKLKVQQKNEENFKSKIILPKINSQIPKIIK